MPELPRMPVDVSVALSDCAHLTAEEYGCYWRILFTMWLHGGRVRDDDRELAQIAGVSRQRWRIVSVRVRRFFTSAGGELSQKRVTATWSEVQERRAKNALGGHTRWNRARAKGHQPGQHRAQQGGQHEQYKESNKGEETSSSESGAARARDAAAQQADRGKYDVRSPQLKRQLG